jgi:glycosyltransferase involved in cell wall biosynthesis
MIEPLVSIGIPTYNRPDGLRRTLKHVTQQSYKNLEIIVSDNASLGVETESVVKEFCQSDRSIKYFRQDKNEGACFNFMFVLEKSTGDYFMWAADDDYFDSTDLVKRLVEECTDQVLVFPDFNLFNSSTGTTSKSVLSKSYGSCQSETDYLLAWCRSGAGYPFYGLYNIDKFNQSSLLFEFDHCLKYYNEGTFLHRIFLNGKIKFVSDVSVNITEGGSISSDKLVLIGDLLQYIRSSAFIFFKTHKLSTLMKMFVIFDFMGICSMELLRLSAQALRASTQRKHLVKYIISDYLYLLLIIYAPWYTLFYSLRRVENKFLEKISFKLS